MSALSLITDGMIGGKGVTVEVAYNITYPLDVSIEAKKEKVEKRTIDISPITKTVSLNVKREGT